MKEQFMNSATGWDGNRWDRNYYRWGGNRWNWNYPYIVERPIVVKPETPPTPLSVPNPPDKNNNNVIIISAFSSVVVVLLIILIIMMFVLAKR